MSMIPLWAKIDTQVLAPKMFTVRNSCQAPLKNNFSCEKVRPLKKYVAKK